MTRLCQLLALAAAVGLLPPARADKPAADRDAPWHVDDDEVYDDFMAKLRELAKAKTGIPADRLKELVAEDRTATLRPAKPSAEKLDPEDVYRKALPGVFLIGSVLPDPGPKDDKEPEASGGYVDGRMATAWVLAADGVLVTNWHVFDGAEAGEAFGVRDHRGNVYPVTDVLAVSRKADLAVIKVAAAGLTPLPVAERAAPVGAWVGVLGHPGDRYFTFTQGAVSRYSRVKRGDGETERWMAITADYAYGSSGSPVLDRTGAVVGMAALTESLDYPEDQPGPPDDPKPTRRLDGPPDKAKPQEKPGEPKPAAPLPAAKGSSLQMVIKLAVPAGEIRRAVGAK